MRHKERLLARLDAIGRSLAETGHALALLGQGSSGAGLDRLDDYSDLDFFALVEAGHKRAYLDDLGWLSRLAPVAYSFANTPDGFKLLYADGLFCEFAVFELDELRGVAAAGSRVVWQAPGFDVAAYLPAESQPPAPKAVDDLVGEALTNLYVGLGRYRRGEKLSALRFVQGYALDRVLDLAEALAAAEPTLPATASRDPFVADRRFEMRHPRLAARLPAFAPGYANTPAAAKAILAFLEEHAHVNPALRAAILDLC